MPVVTSLGPVLHWPVGLCLLIGLMGCVQPAASANGAGLVDVVSGDLPLILSAPHGGRAAVPGASVRTGEGVARFTTVRDLRTDRLAYELADRLAVATGRRPYLVVARFARTYADVNRPPADGVESPAGAAVYAKYHAAIATACAEIINRWGRGLLLDLHAQGRIPSGLIRGTAKGATVGRLIERAGSQALIGPLGWTGRWADEGFSVVPAPGEPVAAERIFTGGYIVRHHGGRAGCGVDAIQIEHGGDLLRLAALPGTADREAAAITKFLADYYPW